MAIFYLGAMELLILVVIGAVIVGAVVAGLVIAGSGKQKDDD